MKCVQCCFTPDTSCFVSVQAHGRYIRAGFQVVFGLTFCGSSSISSGTGAWGPQAKDGSLGPQGLGLLDPNPPETSEDTGSSAHVTATVGCDASAGHKASSDVNPARARCWDGP